MALLRLSRLQGFHQTDRQYRSLLGSDFCTQASRPALTPGEGGAGTNVAYVPFSLENQLQSSYRLCCALKFVWRPRLSAPNSASGGSDSIGDGHKDGMVIEQIGDPLAS